MRHHCSQFIIIPAAVFWVLVAAGCRTPAQITSNRTVSSADEETSLPILNRGDYPERLGLAMQEVLAHHGFTLPWTIVRGSAGWMWFVVDRFESGQRFDRLYVGVSSGDSVTASIAPYVRAPSDWAILGRLFNRGPQATSIEASSIAAELRKRWTNMNARQSDETGDCRTRHMQCLRDSVL